MIEEVDLTIKYLTYKHIKHFSPEEQALIKAAQEASEHAYSPYSKFNVGVALALENGKIITGNNQENKAYPSGMCAERVAFYHAGAVFKNQKILRVAIAAKKNQEESFQAVSPCGACRQVMLEYEEIQKDPIEIIVKGEGDQYHKFKSVGSLIPFRFEMDK